MKGNSPYLDIQGGGAISLYHLPIFLKKVANEIVNSALTLQYAAFGFFQEIISTHLETAICSTFILNILYSYIYSYLFNNLLGGWPFTTSTAFQTALPYYKRKITTIDQNLDI